VVTRYRSRPARRFWTIMAMWWTVFAPVGAIVTAWRALHRHQYAILLRLPVGLLAAYWWASGAWLRSGRIQIAPERVQEASRPLSNKQDRVLGQMTWIAVAAPAAVLIALTVQAVVGRW